MSELIHIRKKGSTYKVHICMPMEREKADTIARIVQNDAGEAVIQEIGNETRVKLKAKSVVTPVTMRQIINILAY